MNYHQSLQSYIREHSQNPDHPAQTNHVHGEAAPDCCDFPTSISINSSRINTHFPHHHILTSASAIPGILDFGGGHIFSHNGEQFEYQGEETDDVISEPANSISSEPTFSELPLRLPLWGIVVLVIGYVLVFVCGVIGNCSVLFVVIKLRRMKTLVNLFIFNLAVADLLVLTFCLLPNMVSNIFVPWVLGWYLCKIVPYVQGVSVCASIYSLLAISVERCISIQWPFKYLVTKGKAKVIILIIWIWSGIVALPWALFFQSGSFDVENPHLEFCVEVWPENYSDWDTYYFLVGNLLICYVFPLGVILASYFTIWIRMYRRQIPSDSYHEAIKLIHQRSKTAVLKMITVVVLIFALSWLPLYVIISRLKFGPENLGEMETAIISFVYPIAQWLICFNSCMNAIIYSFLNHKFRKAFKKILNQGFFGKWRKEHARVKHKSPTVNILLKRFSTYRVETTTSRNFDEDSSESI